MFSLRILFFSGFLRSDTLVGTVIVKLQPLESKCEIHDTFNVSMSNNDFDNNNYISDNRLLQLK